jgi:hypothetical protein
MQQWNRVSNTSWAYATADQLWDGEDDLLTPEEYREMLHWQWEMREEDRISRTYGDSGYSIINTGDYEQLLAEEARAGLYGIPNPYAMY